MEDKEKINDTLVHCPAIINNYFNPLFNQPHPLAGNIIIKECDN